jgi:hypothetical protein
MRADEFIIEGIERIKPFPGGKRDLVHDQSVPKDVKPLPGGSGLLYSVSKGMWGSDIRLWDPKSPEYAGNMPKPVKQTSESYRMFQDRLFAWSNKRLQPGQLVGKLTVDEVGVEFPLKNALRVNYITVDQDYRHGGLAKALYGIVLSIMKRPLLAGDSQSPGGRRNWISISQIPGVEMKGYVSIDAEELAKNQTAGKIIDTIMGRLGGQYIGKSQGNEFFAFDVQPNTTTQELEAAVKTNLSKIYHGEWGRGDHDVGLMAIWSGK